MKLVFLRQQDIMLLSCSVKNSGREERAVPRLQSDQPNHFVLQHSGNLLVADKNIEWRYCKSSQNLIMLHKGQDFKTYDKRGEE